MYVVAKISILMVSHFVLAEAGESVTRTFPVSTDFPSRLYLPTSPNPEPKNRARTSDIGAVLENDLQVIPLAADHDQRNGFQYQPIISREYSRVFTESPRYSQSAVPNLPQTGNARGPGSPISNANEVKPITKSQLSREAVGYISTTKGNSPKQADRRGSYVWCLGRLQSQETPFDQTPGNLPRRKIVTVNDQEDNTKRERLSLQLTPPREEGISRISRHRIDGVSLPGSSTKSIPSSGPWSKETVLIGQPSTYDHRDIKPVFESHEYGANYDNYNNRDDYNEGDRQLGDRDAGSFNGHSKRPAPSKIAAEVTCTNILGRFLLQAYQGYNYGYNAKEHLPTDPILALLLSHYGRYLPGIREPRVYSYMAVNNIHNNKPFGSYKLTADEDGSFVY